MGFSKEERWRKFLDDGDGIFRDDILLGIEDMLKDIRSF